jgi:hypothetical protein
MYNDHREEWYNLQVDGRLPLDIDDGAGSEEDDAELLGCDAEGREIYVL